MQILDKIRQIAEMGRKSPDDITANMRRFEQRIEEYRAREYMDLLKPKNYTRVEVIFPDKWSFNNGYGWHVGNDNLQGYYLVVMDKRARGVVMVHSARVNKVNDEDYIDWKNRNGRS